MAALHMYFASITLGRLDHFHWKSVALVSLDIKDLYYSSDQVLLLKRVRDASEDHAVNFQTSASISIDTLLELL